MSYSEFDERNLPYQTGTYDDQKPMRIPIAGPAPFNTLAVVRGRIFTTQGAFTDDVLHRFTVAVATNFKLAGYDQRVKPVYQHSTSVALQIIQQTEETSFVTAVDEIVDGFFNDDGRWVIVFRVAGQWDGGWAQSCAYISSWVMCHEPPLPPDLPKGTPSKFENYQLPPRYSIIARGSSEGDDSDRKRDRYLRRNKRRRAKELEPSPAGGLQAAARGAPALNGEGSPFMIPSHEWTGRSD